MHVIKPPKFSKGIEAVFLFIPFWILREERWVVRMLEIKGEKLAMETVATSVM